MAATDAFSKLLTSQGIISPEQLAEASRVAGNSGARMADEIVKLGYAPADKVMAALAKAYRMKLVDLAA